MGVNDAFFITQRSWWPLELREVGTVFVAVLQ